MSTGDWVALGVGLPSVLLGALALRHSMRRDAQDQENRLQDRIWQLEDQLREKPSDD